MNTVTQKHITITKTFVVIKNSKTGEVWNLFDKVWMTPTNSDDIWECHFAETTASQEYQNGCLGAEKFIIGDEHLDYIYLTTLTIEAKISY